MILALAFHTTKQIRGGLLFGDVLGQCVYSYLWADLVSNSVFHGGKPSKHLQTTHFKSST